MSDTFQLELDQNRVLLTGGSVINNEVPISGEDMDIANKFNAELIDVSGQLSTSAKASAFGGSLSIWFWIVLIGVIVLVFLGLLGWAISVTIILHGLLFPAVT